jgi:hypothetical protein
MVRSMAQNEIVDFMNLSYEKFKNLASNDGLSKYEKIGFPDEYRKGFEALIFDDICSKLSTLNNSGGLVVDIGSGCSDLPEMIATHCRNSRQELHLFDNKEMLNLGPYGKGIVHWEGKFPNDHRESIKRLKEGASAIIVYSVIQYVELGKDLIQFLDSCLELLSIGGELLIGDIPNESMRNRFLKSGNGISFTEKLNKDNKNLEVSKRVPSEINDRVLLEIITYVRDKGYHAWIVPQNMKLPMANRREDILIRKP